MPKRDQDKSAPMIQPTWLDRGISYLFPAWGAKRMTNRAMVHALATYAAAENNRKTRRYRQGAGSADAANMNDQATLRNRSRGMYRDNPHATSIIDAYGRNVVGPGIRPQSAVVDQQGNPDADFNAAADRLWEQWANPEVCDIEGRKSFYEIQAMAESQSVEAGQVFVTLVFGSQDGINRPVPLTLQMLEDEHLDTMKTSHEGNQVRRGIEVNRWNRPLAYHFFERPINDVSGFRFPKTLSSRRIEARNVIHVGRQHRPQETHQVTRLHSTLSRLQDLSEYDDAERYAAKVAACIGLITKRKGGLGTLLPRNTEDATDSAGNTNRFLEPGMILELSPDEDCESFNPNRPGNTYAPYKQSVNREVAAGAELGYEVVARDYHQGNYSSQRQSMLEDGRVFDVHQEYLCCHLNRVVWEQVITLGVIAGLLPVSLTEFMANRDRYLKVDWLVPARPWIDPLKEVKAEVEAINARIQTRQQSIGKRGGHWRDTFTQIGEEKREAEAQGITLPEVAETEPEPVPDDDEDNNNPAFPAIPGIMPGG